MTHMLVSVDISIVYYQLHNFGISDVGHHCFDVSHRCTSYQVRGCFHCSPCRSSHLTKFHSPTFFFFLRNRSIQHRYFAGLTVYSSTVSCPSSWSLLSPPVRLCTMLSQPLRTGPGRAVEQLSAAPSGGSGEFCWCAAVGEAARQRCFCLFFLHPLFHSTRQEDAAAPPPSPSPLPLPLH